MSFLAKEDLALLKDLNILYVEDDKEIQNVFTKFFIKFCKNLYSAYDGEEGYNIFISQESSENPIDIIITDTNMPMLSGMEMAQRIRDINNFIPIIMITANQEQTNLKKAFEVGIVGYIIKPIDMKELFQNISRAMVTIKNIKYEKELKKLNETLEERVKVQKEQLVKQSRHAAMGEMISMIAHQWRQPLSTISSIVSNINISVDLDDIQKDVLKDDLKKITNLNQYLSQTINDFRNFFLPNKSKEISNVKTIVEETHNLLSHMLRVNDIDFINNCSSEVEIQVYKNEFVQVLINIIKNGIDQLINSENNKIVIEDEEIDDKVLIKICDNGGGIDKDILPRIFEPYFSTKTEKNGTGLGLYMSKMIIEEHLDGNLFVENNDKGGATFIIELLKHRR